MSDCPMLRFKVTFKDEIRRFSLPLSSNYCDLMALISQILRKCAPDDDPGCYQLKYTDDEGDKILVGTQLEYEELQRISDGVIRLSLEPNIPCIPSTTEYEQCRSEPIPSPKPPKTEYEPCYFYNSDGSKVSVDEGTLETLKNNVSAILMEYCANGKTPEWMNATLSHINSETVDIDLPTLSTSLHKQALRLMEFGDLNGALKCMDYEESVTQVPVLIRIYNRACLHSRRGETELALEHLRKAVDAGFKDVDHLISDDDLTPLRQFDAFRRMVQELQQKKLAGPSPK